MLKEQLIQEYEIDKQDAERQLNGFIAELGAVNERIRRLQQRADILEDNISSANTLIGYINAKLQALGIETPDEPELEIPNEPEQESPEEAEE